MTLQRWMAVAVALLGAGCATGPELVNLLQAAADRQSCVYYQVAAAPYGFIRGVTATGGADLETCLKER